jgi:hypothetical protein
VQGGGSQTGEGGSVAIQSGTGATAGDVTISTPGGAAVSVLGSGDASISSAAGKSIGVSAGAGGNIVAQASGSGELLFKHGDASNEGDVTVRMTKDSVISHVPVQAPVYGSPADSRIKTDVQDVDESDILQRMQQLEVKEYQYTDEWQNVRGIGNTRQRGLIAQDVAQKFPEYVRVIPKYELTEKGFEMDNFYELNKQAIVVDLLAAFQAQHKRFNVAPTDATSTGEVSVTSADAGEGTASGSVCLGSGAGATSGAVSISSGSTGGSGTAGDVSLAGGCVSIRGGRDVSVISGGSTSGASGQLTLTSAEGMSGSGDVTLSTGSAADGAAGSVSIKTGLDVVDANKNAQVELGSS